jgi:hypothetical protein
MLFCSKCLGSRNVKGNIASELCADEVEVNQTA